MKLKIFLVGLRTYQHPCNSEEILSNLKKGANIKTNYLVFLKGNEATFGGNVRILMTTNGMRATDSQPT